MWNATQLLANVTVGSQFITPTEKILFTTLNMLLFFIFLYINIILLYTLRSKHVFCETPRYVLLYNLLLADTILLVLSQILYILAIARVLMIYYVCGILTMISNLTNEISPMTLVVMSLERYVAVCFPLRHAELVTLRNTGVAIAVVWTVSSVNVCIRIILLSTFPFETLESLTMRDFCADTTMLLVPAAHTYDRIYICIVFVTAAAAVTFSFIGVMVAARSASTDKSSINKARKTLMLHMVQLCLSLSSNMYLSINIVMSKVFDRLVIVRMQTVIYVVIFIFPRCLTALIYGLRDQTIRTTFFQHLSCSTK